jgi:hypothetical protein
VAFRVKKGSAKTREQTEFHKKVRDTFFNDDPHNRGISYCSNFCETMNWNLANEESHATNQHASRNVTSVRNTRVRRSKAGWQNVNLNIFS